MSHQTNITRIKAVYNALSVLQDAVVFVGGATVSLYAERRTEEVRPTDDVDVLIELWSYRDYSEVEQQLCKMGFVNDAESKVICRYKIQGITVDIMATGENVLGFSNGWYPDGFKNAIDVSLTEDCSVKIFSSPYFIASKLEAFTSPTRENHNDGIFSSDFEDIIFVLENRSSVWQEMKEAPERVKKYLQQTFAKLMNHPEFEEWVDAHAGYGSPPATAFILESLKGYIV